MSAEPQSDPPGLKGSSASTRVVWIAIAAVGLLLAALAPVPVATLVAPYATRPIPADCTSGSSHVPVDRVQDVAGIGSVALVAADSSA